MHWLSGQWICLSPTSHWPCQHEGKGSDHWKKTEMKLCFGAVQISVNSFRSSASCFLQQNLRACGHVFEKFCSKNFEQQLQVQHEKSFHLVPLEMVARRVSRELFGMWTSKHCFHIRVHIHSKCMIEKPKNQLSEKLMGGAGRVMRPSHCKIIRLCFSFCSALEKSGVSGGRIFDPKKKKKAGEFLSNLTLWAGWPCDSPIGAYVGQKQLTS